MYYPQPPCTVAGIPVMEHLEFNVVPLAVSVTAKFFQTMQHFFFPKAEEAEEESSTDHSRLFGPGGTTRTYVSKGGRQR